MPHNISLHYFRAHSLCLKFAFSISVFVIFVPARVTQACSRCCSASAALAADPHRAFINETELAEMKKFYTQKFPLPQRLLKLIDRLGLSQAQSSDIQSVREAFTNLPPSRQGAELRLEGDLTVQAEYLLANHELIFSIIDLRAHIGAGFAPAGAMVPLKAGRSRSLYILIMAFLIEIYEVLKEHNEIGELVILARSVHDPAGSTRLSDFLISLGFQKIQTKDVFPSYSLRVERAGITD